MEAVFKDPLLPAYWFDKPLIYTIHAKERCVERDIDELDFLPINSKLVDCDKDKSGRVGSVCFKINSDNPHYMVLAIDGAVITVFGLDKKGMISYQHRKNLRRYYVKQLNVIYGDENHKLISHKRFK